MTENEGDCNAGWKWDGSWATRAAEGIRERNKGSVREKEGG